MYNRHHFRSMWMKLRHVDLLGGGHELLQVIHIRLGLSALHLQFTLLLTMYVVSWKVMFSGVSVILFRVTVRIGYSLGLPKLGSFFVHVTLHTSRSMCAQACAISSSLCVLFSSSLICFCTAFFFLSSFSCFSSSPSSVVVLLGFRLVCFFDRVKRPFFFMGGLPAKSEKHVALVFVTEFDGTGIGNGNRTNIIPKFWHW